MHRVLLVDDDEGVLAVMNGSLTSKGLEVVAVGGVTDALKCIATEKFDVLVRPAHAQPAALTMLLSGFPDVKSAMEAIILEADEIIVKPVGVKDLAELVRERLLVHKPAIRQPKERVSEILRRCSDIANRVTMKQKRGHGLASGQPLFNPRCHHRCQQEGRPIILEGVYCLHLFHRQF
jgi:DNA-binding NtrC family response regulator